MNRYNLVKLPELVRTNLIGRTKTSDVGVK